MVINSLRTMSDSESAAEDSEGPRQDEWYCENEKRMAKGYLPLPKPGQDERNTSDFDFLKPKEVPAVAEELDETRGLRDDPIFGKDDLTNYELAVSKYGDYVRKGSQALIKSFKRKVTSVEARVYADRDSVARHSGWENELDEAASERDPSFPVYKDDTDEFYGCVANFRKGGSEFLESARDLWYKELGNPNDCTNPKTLLHRAREQMVYMHDEEKLPPALALQAFIADLYDDAKDLDERILAEEERCKGMYNIVTCSTEPHLTWLNPLTKQVYQEAPTSAMINHERAQRVAKKTPAETECNRDTDGDETDKEEEPTKRRRDDDSDDDSAGPSKRSRPMQYATHPDKIYGDALEFDLDLAAARQALQDMFPETYLERALDLCKTAVPQADEYAKAEQNDGWPDRVFIEMAELEEKLAKLKPNRKRSGDSGDAPPRTRTSKSDDPAVEDRGGAMPFIKGSKRAVTKDVQAKRPAPTDRQEPKCGMVPYRTDAVEHNPIGERECVIEAVRAALGSTHLTRKFLGLPLKGDLNFKEVVQALKAKTAFRFVKSPPVPWSGLITIPQGIYIGRAVLKDREAHYMVYDAWRHVIFVGGAPPPAPLDPIEHLLLEDAPAPTPDDNVGRSWFVEEHELLDPSKFQEYMRKTLNVGRGIDNLYRVDMIAKRARDTDYNTPEHYD